MKMLSVNIFILITLFSISISNAAERYNPNLARIESWFIEEMEILTQRVQSLLEQRHNKEFITSIDDLIASSMLCQNIAENFLKGQQDNALQDLKQNLKNGIDYLKEAKKTYQRNQNKKKIIIQPVECSNEIEQHQDLGTTIKRLLDLINLIDDVKMKDKLVKLLDKYKKTEKSSKRKI